LTARRYGINTRDITLYPIGGVASLERMPTNPFQELAISLAGPAVNVVIAAALFVGVVLGGVAGYPASFLSPVGGSFLMNLMWVNVALVIFNLLPAFPMDGGRVLRAFLAMQMPHASATIIAARVGQVIAIVLGLVGLFTGSMLLLVALFVFLAAQAELNMARIRGGAWQARPHAAPPTAICHRNPDTGWVDDRGIVWLGEVRTHPSGGGERIVVFYPSSYR
jgi:Zn-dependent protease